MQKALDLVKQHGKIIRYRGGYWAQAGAPMVVLELDDLDKPSFTIPKDHFFTTTVEGLYNRGLIKASYWQHTERGLFITEYEIV